MKKFLLFLCVISLFLFSSCSGPRSVIKRIAFTTGTGTATQRKCEYEYAGLQNRAEELDQSLGVPKLYAIRDRNWDSNKLLELFQIKNPVVDKGSNQKSGVSYEADGAVLFISNTGTLNYSKAGDLSKAVPYSDDDVKKMAQEFLKNDLFDLSGFEMEEEVQHGIASDAAKLITSKSVIFNRTLNNLRVYGNSKIIVSYGSEGLSGFNYVFNDTGETVDYKPIGVKEALAKLLTVDSMQSFGRQKNQGNAIINHVLVDQVEMIYWEDAASNSNMFHIQPCYFFSGTATDALGRESTFHAIVRAVPDSMTVPS